MAGAMFPKCLIAGRANNALFIKRSLRNTARLFLDEKAKPDDAAPTVHISRSCVDRLQELGKGTTLRIGVDGGGCSGFQYSFELDSPAADGDHVIAKDGVAIIVDETSLNYLKGATIEYHSELIRSSFRVVNNPLAEGGCSCGASFNLKLPEG